MLTICRFIATLVMGLILSNAALSQANNSLPVSPSRAPPATSSTTDDDGNNPLTRAGDDYSPTGSGTVAQQPSTVGRGPNRSGSAGPDASDQPPEPPSITGNGTAGE
jgi:hypothetical protein